MDITKALEIELDAIDKKSRLYELMRTKVDAVLFSMLFTNGQIHHILPDEGHRNKIFEDLLHYTSVSKDFIEESKKSLPLSLSFHNHQAIGDILTMTCAIRDFKTQFPDTQITVDTTFKDIWKNNPYIQHELRTDTNIVRIGTGAATRKSNDTDLHMCNAYRTCIEGLLNVKIDQGPIRPDLWLTKNEYEQKPLIDGPYWIIVYGGAPHWPVKQYHRWQEVIDILKDKITFVQVGVKDQYPILNNVIDYTGKTDNFRDLINVFLHSQGSVGLVSMHMHMSAAFQNPCVVVAGAREAPWFTQYYGHQYIQTTGTLNEIARCHQEKSCWACKLEGCKNQINNIPKCTTIIEPEEIANAIEKYYKGGRLEYNKKIPNKFFKNIVDDESDKSHIVSTHLFHPEKYGYTWGGSSLTHDDWLFIDQIIDKYNVKSVLEFGAGLSTCLFYEKGLNVVSLETDLKYAKNIPESVKLLEWNGKDVLNLNDEWEFIFVDGPGGGQNREHSIKYASEHSDLVIIHDANRSFEIKYQEQYLATNFDLIMKGGTRCHVWKIKEKVNFERISTKNILQKSMKMITTCRGYGGSERSSIEIMKEFQRQGYFVELVPIKGIICDEYMKNIPQDVYIHKSITAIMNYSDIAIYYTSDTVFTLDNEYYDILTKISADRKVMILNYQLGWAGRELFSLGWDKYIFLNSTKQTEFLQRYPTANTVVLAPPTDLTKLFDVKIDYNFPLRLIRHSSQGDAKHPVYTNDFITDLRTTNENANIEFYFMPARSNIVDAHFIYKFKQNQLSITEFLSKGNCFFYHLPPGYQDQGPRVIIEAMSAGLPVIADNRYGAKDRVNNDTGWLCNTVDDYFDVINEIVNNPEILQIKGTNARKFAKENFVIQKWYNEIIN